MGRVYTAAIPAGGIAVTAVQDFLSLQSTSSMAFRVLKVIMMQVTISTTEILPISLKRFSGAYSIGSVGSSITPVKANFGDAAATVTARRNDTTQTSGGTSVTWATDGFNEVNGYADLMIPDKELIIAPSQALILSIDAAPAASRTMLGYIEFEELF